MRLVVFLAVFGSAAMAGDAGKEWAQVLALDAGPAAQPKTQEEALQLSLAHLGRQEKALRAFLSAHADAVQIVEARLRLARLLNMRADLKMEAAPAESPRLLDEADKTATTAAQRAEVDFARLAQGMRAWRGKRPPMNERRVLFEAMRKFETAHPEDRRVAAVMVEVSALFESEPRTMEALLREANKLTRDPALKARITDDLKRLGFFEKVLPLRFTALDGTRYDARESRGKVVVILFFATWSMPAKTAFMELQRLAVGSDVVFVVVGLDKERATLEAFLKEAKSSARVAWDGKGWESPLIQALGVNAVPAIWLLDRDGVVRTLDALDQPAEQIEKLLGSR